MLVAQLGDPVIELTLTLARLQPLALPHAVVQVLHRQRGQGRQSIIEESFVQLAQFAGKNIHRPAFGDDVVQGQHKVMFTLPGLDHARPQQRAVFQIKRGVCFVVGQRVQALLKGLWIKRAQVQPRQVQSGLAMNLLTGHTINTGKSGA